MASSQQGPGRKLAPALLTVLAAGVVAAGGDLGNLGSFPAWSKIELDLPGPTSDALSSDPNPFEIEVAVQFSGPGGQFSVPAFFDGDGNGGDIGNIWRVRFSPAETGNWTFATVSEDSGLDAYQGSFFVTEPASCAEYEPGGLPDFGCHGRLNWVGEHYLKLADGPFWLKGGMDDPEDFLAPGVTVGFPDKTAALEYLADRGVNSLYFLTHNVGGDHDNVSPWSIDSDHFALARMAEWEEILSRIQDLGIVLHVVLEDDSGWTGFNRPLYYREMVARFGHHNGLIWNVSEEYNENYSPMQAKAFAQTISDLDAYGHPITVHHQSELFNWNSFLGDDRFDLTSFQTPAAPQNSAAVAWFDDVEQAGRIIPISFDETGANGGSDRHIFWSVYMGGANFELHLQPLDDYRDHEDDLDDLTRARTFIEELPFWEMRPSNELLLAGSGYVFAKAGEVYAVYLPDGGNLEIDLTAGTSDFEVVWFNPRDGSRFADGMIGGGETVSLAAPDHADWALLLRSIANVEPQALDQNVVTPMGTALQVTLSHDDSDGPGPYLFMVADAPPAGSLTDDDGDESLVYTPDPGFSGEDSFTWQVDDGLALSDVATVVINVYDPASTPPVADNAAVATDEDMGAPIELSAIDVDGDPLSFELESPPLHGTLAGTPPWLHYTPHADFHGADSFTFAVNDGRGGSDIGAISITVHPVADPPRAYGYGFSTQPETAIDLTLQATDIDGDVLTYEVRRHPSAGTLLGDAGSPLRTYVPDPGFHGVDNFVFRVFDGAFRSNEAAVFVTVTEATELLWDDFDRPDDSALQHGWVEYEAGGTAVTIEGNALSFSATADAADRPLVRHVFPRITTGLLHWEFTFDWLRSGSEGTYRLFMQLGDDLLMTVEDQETGVGISLLWSHVDENHETLAYRYDGLTHALTTVQGRATLSVFADLDMAAYEVQVDGLVVGSAIPFDPSVALNTVRFFTDNVNHANFAGRAFDDLRISGVGGSGGSPLSVVLDRTQIYWSVLSNEVGYDVIRGDLGLLHGSGGDFSTAVLACLEDDLPANRLGFNESPLPGEAWWFLVRAVESSQAESYDTSGYPTNGQAESRNSGIEGSSWSCP